MVILPFLAAAGALYAVVKTYKKRNARTSKPRFLLSEAEGANGSSETSVSEAERDNHRKLAVSLTCLGLTTVGSLIYAPLLLLSVPGLIYVVYPFLKNGYRSLVVERKITMGVIDMIAIPGVLVAGYLFAASLGSFLYYLSVKLLMKTEDQSRKSLINVFGQQPRFVWVLVEGVELEVPFEKLTAGQIVVVNAGEMVPVDGIITAGAGSIDQHRLTGEAQPVEKGPGDSILASTMLLAGRIYIEVESAGEDTVAAKIGELLGQTADYKLSIQSRGEAIADKSALPTLLLGAVALPVSGISGALAVLGSSLGYNMRIIAPLSVLNFLRITSQNGILIKDGRSLEMLRQVDTVIFDKTGTLTLEQPHVSRLHACDGLSEDELLTYAAAAEYRQMHPIAKAILAAADERGLTLPGIEDAQYEVGYGIKVTLAHQLIRVGSDRFMEMEGIAIPAEIRAQQRSCHENGYSLVMIAIDGQLAGAIELHPTIRSEARDIVERLQRYNLSVYIISGDHDAPTKRLAEELGVDHYVANALPERKAELIKQLQQEGKTVCFVGDGINDAIALKQANVSISLRGATTIAVDTAQIVLMDASLHQLAHLFDIANQFDSNMKVNFLTTIIPGVVCIGGVFLLHFGIIWAIILYNLSLLVGVSNAMLPVFKQPPLLQPPDSNPVS